MLNFAAEWPWAIKSIIATLILTTMTVVMMHTQKQYGYGGEKFLFAWSVGFVLSFVFFACVSSTFTVSALFTPGKAFISIMLFGFLLGGMANIFLGQAIPMASNPGLVWAILGSNAALSYLATFFAAKILPNQFPPIEFSLMNFAGIVVLVIGLVMVMQPSK